MQPLVLAEPERPFWGFAELMLAAAIFMAAVGTAIGLARAYLNAPKDSGLWSVSEEAVAYAVLFLALKIMFARYGKGLLDSLAWSKPGPFSVQSLAGVGLSVSLISAVLQRVLQTPDVDTPFDKLLDDPASRIAVGLFSVTFGPVVEELLFRGFLQPVLVGVAGVFPGILLTSVLFGAVHLGQYGNVWQTGVLLMLVGFVFGTIRHVSGSTRASAIAHIAFNSLPFIALLAAGNPLTKQ
jgi:membrane protease YdiL (CAAX protease family)